MVQESYTKQVMDDTKLFPAWLQDHGLTLETAQAIVSELGIKTPGALGACSGSLTMRAELFSLAKQKLPFAMYAEFRRFVESRLEPQYVQAGSPLLVAVLHSMLIAVSQELSKCAQKLISFDIVPASQDSQEEAFGDAGLRILDVCSLQQQDKNMNSELVLPVVIPQVPSCSETSTSGLFCGEIDEKLEDTQHLNTSIVESICEVSNKTKEINHCVIDDDIIQGSGQVGVVSDGDLKFETSESSSYDDIVALEDGNFHNDIVASSQEILNHVQVKQEHDADENLDVSTNSAAETSLEKPRLLSCSRCSDMFLTEDELQLHMDTHHKKGGLYKCTVCRKNFSTKQSVKIHNRIHTGERPYKCSVCGKSFTAKNSVTIHMRTHTGERLFKCPVCGRTFTIAHHVKSHMKTHTGERPYKCFVCGKNFSEKSSVKIPMRTHTGERPFKCSVCGKSFTAKNSVTIHMRTHTGERLFECPVCARTFTVAHHVKSHMKTHTGERPYNCFVCGKTFSEKSSVKIHMRTHTGERPYKCSVCGRGFSARNSVKIHMSTHSAQEYNVI
uniref:C2H2-type domain-containing protein n=1 Tax=Eptatretus burgeri TaxID=7764 RepID=A0A8C4PXK5_EPTBU